VEPKNHKIIKGFLNDNEIKPIIDWVNSIDHVQKTNYGHLVEIGKALKGNSHMFDISKTESTKKVTTMQSGDDVMSEDVPQFITELVDRVAKSAGIPAKNVFMQVVDTNKGGKIKAHYDIGINGFIIYKCNLSVLSEDYQFHVDGDCINVEQGDLYCFEASLYKHWTNNEFNSRRVLLSFGFVLPYEVLGREVNDPRIRLSQRIEKYIQ
jgi:hypothetical protein